MPEAFCPTCTSSQEVEFVEDSTEVVYCLACGEEFALKAAGVSDEGGGGKFANYKIGRIMKVEPVAKSKDLKLCHIDVTNSGDESTFLPVVTNAKYAEAGWKVVVACVGAIVPAGATWSGADDDTAMKVTKRNVSGVESRGMLCDCPMLGWSGGAKGFIAQLPDTYSIGDAPPDSRPRV
jgi:tRNA-binding EMAP/Myf-like protein